MTVHPVDIAIVIAFLLLSLGIALLFRKRASKSLTAFFLGNRDLPWGIAGISMVATTFAADTPLAVAEIVGKNGISGNWIWWSFLAGGMLTTFYFARLWRRSGVLTEVELIELRYGGRPAAFLRGFKAVYLGLVMNVVIIGWVNLAMLTLFQGFFGLDEVTSWYCLGGAMLLAALYTAISGLWGVAVTDVVQFCLAMIGTTTLAFLVVRSPEVGGMEGLKAQLGPDVLRFFPAIGSQTDGGGYSLGVGAFAAFAAVQWWSSWYPGQEPGGGGYVAQRMMSTKSERGALYATLLFQIGHYCLRPWPWIIVGLAAMVLYPHLTGNDVKMGYVYAMRDYLPTGLRGLLMASFLAAYLSTISTQLNWGAGYLANDLYARFTIDEQNRHNQTRLVGVSRAATILLMLLGLWITTWMTSISGAWGFVLECGAGLGLVLILRWYWWRINAWSEIAATITPFGAYAVSHFWLNLQHPDSFFFTVGITTLVWIVVTYLTPPEDPAVLKRFHEQVQPGGWWGPIGGHSPTRYYLALAWISAIVMAYGFLFFTGKLLLGFNTQAALWLGVALVALLLLKHAMKKNSI
jgi:Na+/proline symporter